MDFTSELLLHSTMRSLGKREGRGCNALALVPPPVYLAGSVILLLCRARRSNRRTRCSLLPGQILYLQRGHGDIVHPYLSEKPRAEEPDGPC